MLNDEPDGTKTLTCPDGSKANLGKDNACAIVEVNGDKLLRCADGSEANLSAGGSGGSPMGSCTILRGHVWMMNELDASRFASSGCVEITGDLRVAAGDLPDLSALSRLTRVGGRLIIEHNSALTSLSGLSALTHVGEGIIIRDNAALTSIMALSGVGGGAVKAALDELTIEGNPALTSLAGLEGVERVRALTLRELGALTSLQGLGGLRAVEPGGLVHLEGLGALTTLMPLGQLAGQPARLHLQRLPALTSLQGLGGLKRMRTLHLEGLDGLTTLQGLDPVYVEDDLIVRGNAALTSLQGLETMDYDDPMRLFDPPRLNDLIIESNPELVSIAALGSVRGLRGSLIIHDNAKFTTWWSVTPIYQARRFVITQNQALVKIFAFSMLYDVDEILIADNDSLRDVGFRGFMSVRRFTLARNPQLSTIRPVDASAFNDEPLSLEEVEELVIDACGLTSLERFSARDVRRKLQITRNTQLDHCLARSFASQREVPHLELWGNDQWTSPMCP